MVAGLARDTLFLLEPAFEDTILPGRRFYCGECITLEGVLASYPELKDRIDVVHVPFARPRAPVVQLVGETNQALPLLVLAPDAPAQPSAKEYEGTRFVDDLDEILQTLHLRHGIAEKHP